MFFLFENYLKLKLNHSCYWFLYSWIEKKVGIILAYLVNIVLGYFWRNIHNLVMLIAKNFFSCRKRKIFFSLQNTWEFNLVTVLLKVSNIVFSKCLHYWQIIDSSTLFQLMFSISALIHYQLVTQLKFCYRSQMN